MRFFRSKLQSLQCLLSESLPGSNFLSATVAVVLLSALLPSAGVAQESVSIAAETTDANASQSVAINADSVNINTADAETLALALDGVGLTRALDIIAYREEYGEFKNVEQIQQVRGIGIATFARNRTKMRVSDVE